ncbi:MAG: glycosyltransferase [Actinomycetota bacterium]|nr:glycosyltransferase [Actinomycetota bacterium]
MTVSPTLPPQRAPGASGPVGLLSVPARHPYVDAVRPPAVTPIGADRTVGWEPDPVLDPAALAGWVRDADVVHVHFGYDHLTPASARSWLVALRRTGVPFVLTVHDLRNPHHTHRHQHDAVLSELVAGAAVVLTLTPGAATEVRARFGRVARVVAHPTLVDPRRTDDVATEAGLVTLHLKSLRTNLVEPLRLVRDCALGASLGGGRLRVDVHPEVLADLRLEGLDEVAGAEVVVHERYDDLDLERYVRRSHVTVIPHRWGTHSGWLELARDLGTTVVAPSCGHYAGQWDTVVTYAHDEHHGLDDGSLIAAVARAVSQPAPAPADRSQRLRDLEDARRTHAEVYAQVMCHQVVT